MGTRRMRFTIYSTLPSGSPSEHSGLKPSGVAALAQQLMADGHTDLHVGTSAEVAVPYDDWKRVADGVTFRGA